MHRSAALFLCLLAGYPARAAGLAMPDQTAVPGQIVVAPLAFSSQGQAVSGIQFDIDADAGLSLGLLPGAQIGASSKVSYTATLPSRGIRVLIVGLNQVQIGDGELIRPVISVDPAAAAGPARIRISNAIATDPNGNAVAVSLTTATVQVQAPAAGQPGVLSFAAGGIVNAASLLSGPISPGEIVTIFGASGLAAVSTVKFNGTAAPVLYAGPGQVNTIVPFGLDPSRNASIEILTALESLGTLSLGAAAVSPALFTSSSTGNGQGAILNEDYSPNSFSNPASPGSIVMMYGTGFGQVTPPAVEGQTAAAPAPTVLPVTATIAGLPAEVIYAGAAPGLIAGVVQINIRIPAGIRASDAARIALSVGSWQAAPGVAIAVR